MTQQGRGGMGSKKHGQSGHTTKSPRFRFLTKMEAERSSVKDRSRITDPVSSVQQLFRKRPKPKK